MTTTPGSPQWELNALGYAATIMKLIEDDGFMMQGVFDPKEQDPPFAYTVGLTQLELPELVITGMPFEHMQGWLHILGQEHMVNPYQPGVPVTTDGKVTFLPMHAPLTTAGTVSMIYGRYAGRFLQLVWPDNNGLYPTQDGYNTEMTQPLFGRKLIIPGGFDARPRRTPPTET